MEKEDWRQYTNEVNLLVYERTEDDGDRTSYYDSTHSPPLANRQFASDSIEEEAS